MGEFPKLSESFVLNEIYELKSRGHNIVVFACTNPIEDTTHPEMENLDVPVHYFGPPEISAKCGKNVLRTLCHPSFYLFGESIAHPASKLFNGHILTEFENLLNTLKFVPDHIHCHFATIRKLPIAYAAQKHDISISVVPHAYGLFADPDYDALEILFNSVDHIISPTEYNKRYIEEHYLPDTPISVVPAVSQLGNREPRGETVPNRILTVARFTEKKGYPYAIEAVSEVAKEYPDIEYHIIGSGTLEREIRSQIRRHGLENNVTIRQEISDEELTREFSEAAVFLLPCVIAASGDRDGLPVVLKEAMAMETACVSTTVSGIPELISDGETGLLVPPRDATATARAIMALLGDADYREKLASAGKAHVVETNTPEKVVEELDRVFNEIVASNRRGHTKESRGWSRAN